jgi:hypothetical protein
MRPLCVTACTILGYNAASEGCHSTGQLAMSDKQNTGTMSNDALEKVVCLRNSRTAVTVLKGIYVDEAKHVAHASGIITRLSHCGTGRFRLPLLVSKEQEGLRRRTLRTVLAQSREADGSCMFPLSSGGPLNRSRRMLSVRALA